MNYEDDFDLDKIFGRVGRDPQLAHLYKTHPNFDNYPKYMQEALIANERLQGRYTTLLVAPLIWTYLKGIMTLDNSDFPRFPPL